MYKLWKSKNCSDSPIIQKMLRGTIISENLLVQKSLIDDIINTLDGYEPGVVTNSTNWKYWIAELDWREPVSIVRKCTEKFTALQKSFMRNRLFTITVAVR